MLFINFRKSMFNMQNFWMENCNCHLICDCCLIWNVTSLNVETLLLSGYSLKSRGIIQLAVTIKMVSFLRWSLLEYCVSWYSDFNMLKPCSVVCYIRNERMLKTHADSWGCDLEVAICKEIKIVRMQWCEPSAPWHLVLCHDAHLFF